MVDSDVLNLPVMRTRSQWRDLLNCHQWVLCSVILYGVWACTSYSYRLIRCVSVNCSYAHDFYQLFSSLRHTGMVFLGKEVPVWFIRVHEDDQWPINNMLLLLCVYRCPLQMLKKTVLLRQQKKWAKNQKQQLQNRFLVNVVLNTLLWLSSSAEEVHCSLLFPQPFLFTEVTCWSALHRVLPKYIPPLWRIPHLFTPSTTKLVYSLKKWAHNKCVIPMTTVLGEWRFLVRVHLIIINCLVRLFIDMMTMMMKHMLCTLPACFIVAHEWSDKLLILCSVQALSNWLQSDMDIERAQEAELRSKYPNVKGPGASALLQKRLSKGVSFSVFCI